MKEALAPTSTQCEVQPEQSYEQEPDYSDPCPDCGKQLFVAAGGGVKCTCGYWFCF